MSSLQPLGINIGLHGGFGLLPSSLEDQSYLETGLIANIEFGKRWSLISKFQWSRMRYRLRSFDELLGAPSVDPPSPDLVFQGAEVSQPTFDYNIGLRYCFRSKSNWTPFIGLAFGQRKLESYQVFYNFKNATTDVELEVDYQRSQQRLNYLETSLGFHRGLGSKWRFGMAASFRKTDSKVDTSLPSSLGLSAQLLFKIH